MGGNALKNAGVGRVEWHRYFDIWNALNNNPTMGARFELRIIPAYGEKSSFGDMDVLVVGPMDELVSTIHDAFSPKELVVNGDCVSFDFMGIQVDFIKTRDDLVPFNLAYFSFNDLGNFMGRTAYRLGFKYGHDGLWYTLRDDENESRVVKEILLTKEPIDAFAFLGYNYAKWCRGFRNLGEIFEFAASSAYFDPAQYLLSNRSYAARVRDRKRESYKKFLEWIHANYPDLKEDSPKVPVDKEFHLQRAFDMFPAFSHRYDVAMADWQEDKEFRKNFNGATIGGMLGLDGKELGAAMKAAKEYIARHDLKSWIGSLSAIEFNAVVPVIFSAIDREKNDS